ncbi:DUF2474 domain-containing protein [Allorhizobium taibaishanense]|uniref:DUF2474 domain-containing protein n=1 Tax=Allorhizobium taibaishanense TaxID=887144 RepID=A0A7W6HJX7_9HYPH|nr:DUF2474 domain-containing protein [Allorhizobium taibaishanense]MBB4006623.1 hypothetical protein [Allorhizobium taibaishanense]
MTQDEVSEPKTVKQKLLWFAIFWIAGVAVVGAVAASIRLVLMHN